MNPASLYASPNALAAALLPLRGLGAPPADRPLPPGVARLRVSTARRQAWLDAAQLRGRQVGARAGAGRAGPAGFARLLGDARRCIALGANTHELVVRLLSALPLDRGRAWSPRTASSTASAASSTASRRRASTSSGSPRLRSSRWRPARPRGGRPHRPGPGLGRVLRHRTDRAEGSPRWRRAAGGTEAGCWWTRITRSTWCRSH